CRQGPRDLRDSRRLRPAHDDRHRLSGPPGLAFRGTSRQGSGAAPAQTHRRVRVQREVRPIRRFRIASEDDLEKRKIGSLEVSLAGLGCNNFGWRIDAAGTAAVVNAAIDAGINLFDTADIYGGGQSEEYLGKALKGRRDKVLIATKFGMKMGDGKEGGKPAYIRQAVEDSLRRMDTDRIDLYQIHKADPSTPIADTLGALTNLVKAGKVREIGCSNFSA